MISTSRQPASLAVVPTVGQRLANFYATETGLTRTRRVYLNKHTLGAFSLIRDHVQESPPASIVNTLGKTGSCQSLDVQILSRDQTVGVNHGTAQIVVKIRPLSAYQSMSRLKQHYRIPSALRASLTPRYAPLRYSQGAFGFPVIAGVGYLRSVAQGGEVGQSDIDPDHVRIEWQWLGFYIAREQCKPVPALALNGERLNSSVKWSMEVNSHGSDLRYSQSVSLYYDTNLAQRKTIVPSERAKSRIPRPFTAFHTTKKPLKRLIYTPDHVFQCLSVQGRYIWARLSYIRQLINLIEATYGFAFKSPSVAPLLKRGVVKFAANRKLRTHYLNLMFGGIDPKLESLDH